LPCSPRSGRTSPVAALRGKHRWNALGGVVDALDAAFYAAFGNVEPSGRTDAPRSRRLGLDDVGRGRRHPGPDAARRVGGAGARDARDRGGAEIVGFFTGKGGFLKRGRPLHWGYQDGLTPLSISPRQRLDDAVKAVSDLPFGGTDCALPMLYAQALEREIDTFVIYTDSETWAGNIHPADALRAYRRASGIDASLVVVGMVSNGFSIADPNDGGMLDVVGFDTATPQLISDFARGAL
jgi:60 kDa SS-A/Ro ribonucleoprotein